MRSERVSALVMAAAAVVIVGVSWPARAQERPAMSAAEIDTIKRDVTSAVDKYYSSFSQGNMKALPEESFNIPWILIGGSGPQPDLTKEQALARFEASIKQLRASGWGKSVFTTESVCVLNASAAIASGYNTRYKTDGSVMSVSGVAYIFAKTKDGWRIVSYTGQAKDRPVKCD